VADLDRRLGQIDTAIEAAAKLTTFRRKIEFCVIAVRFVGQR
jgi:hypothetical protein